ncbi:MAG: SigB/SigF/SigG family polymerase sigma factor [Acidimicrobiales bacterium]|nr:SigB/SigF/SigG family polymerase sigma factor [Acidimicrobiales bacterium]
MRVDVGSGRSRSVPEGDPRADQEVLDLSEAGTTIPRGSDATDDDPTPAVDETVWLWHVRFARSGDRAELARLVEEYDRYALAFARRFYRARELREDLDQVAREALVVALQRFDPARGIPFPAFATPTISGALRRHIRDRGWALRVPRRAHELTTAARRSSEELTALLRRPPTVSEVADHLHVELDDLLDAQEATYARETASMDAVADASRPLHDSLGDADSGIEMAENRLDLARALPELASQDRCVLAWYYFDELTQSQIADRLGVSQMQVSRILTRALRRLRSLMGASEGLPPGIPAGVAPARPGVRPVVGPRPFLSAPVAARAVAR